MSDRNARPPSFDSLYDGALYAALVEPFQRELHRMVRNLLPPGCSLLDACCGAGGFCLRVASRCGRVVGVDYSARQIAFARRRVAGRGGFGQVSFLTRDASQLTGFEEGEFDFATVALALHEMPPAARVPVLRELARVGRRVIVVDFAVPLARDLPGIATRMVEMGAGPRHFRAFRDYCHRGGLDSLIAAAGLVETSSRTLIEGVLSLRGLR